MNKKTYSITGFDCAHCAAKSEAHLNKHCAIQSARIDFSSDRMFVEYVDEELTTDELLSIIAEVETDPIEISEVQKNRKKTKIFTKDLWVIFARVLFAVVVILIGTFVLDKPELFWYDTALYGVGLIVIIYDIVTKVLKRIIHKENPLDEYLLITICSFGAFAVAIITKMGHTFMECLMVATLFQVGKIIEGIAANKSKDAIMTAVELRVETANKVVDGKIIKVDPEELKIDDVIVVTTGELVPVDSVVIEGEGQVDTSSLTGEFIPARVSKDSELYAGYLLKEGTIRCRATKRYKDSAVNKIIELIANSRSKKSKADEFVTKFARWYTPTVFAIAIIVGIVGGAITGDWSKWVILGLKLLIVSCPCAIVISVPMAYFSALGLASKNGIVVKGTNYLDKLISLKKIVTDKTGTITEGTFEIVKVHSVGVSEEKLIEILQAAEHLSSHPIAKAICKYESGSHNSKQASDFEEIAGLGVYAEYEGKAVLAGNSRLLDEYAVQYEKVEEAGTVVYSVYDNKYIGYVVLSDKLKSDAKEMVTGLNKMGVEVILLTGDKEKNAKEIANELGIKKYQSELLPSQKTEYLEKELSPKYATGFIGDGINDAASIKRADVGFAMGAIGSDSAVENADVVIMTDHPSKVLDALKIAKIARHVAVFNIVAALFIKIGIEIAATISTSFGYQDAIPMWLAVLADTGLTVLLVINSLLILYRKVGSKRV